jgi:hypothetical protein
MSRKSAFWTFAGSLIAASAFSFTAVAGEKQEKLFDSALQPSTVAVGTVDAHRQIGTGQKATRQIGTGQKATRQIGTGQKATRQIGTGQKATRQIGTGQKATRQIGTGRRGT